MKAPFIHVVLAVGYLCPLFLNYLYTTSEYINTQSHFNINASCLKISISYPPESGVQHVTHTQFNSQRDLSSHLNLIKLYFSVFTLLEAGFYLGLTKQITFSSKHLKLKVKLVPLYAKWG